MKVPTILEEFLEVVGVAWQLQHERGATQFLWHVLVHQFQVLIHLVDVCHLVYFCTVKPRLPQLARHSARHPAIWITANSCHSSMCTQIHETPWNVKWILTDIFGHAHWAVTGRPWVWENMSLWTLAMNNIAVGQNRHFPTSTTVSANVSSGMYTIIIKLL